MAPMRNAEQRQIIGFGAAAGEDDFVGRRAQQGGDLAPGFVQLLRAAWPK